MGFMRPYLGGIDLEGNTGDGISIFLPRSLSLEPHAPLLVGAKLCGEFRALQGEAVKGGAEVCFGFCFQVNGDGLVIFIVIAVVTIIMIAGGVCIGEREAESELNIGADGALIRGWEEDSVGSRFWCWW